MFFEKLQTNALSVSSGSGNIKTGGLLQGNARIQTQSGVRGTYTVLFGRVKHVADASGLKENYRLTPFKPRQGIVELTTLCINK